MLPSWRIGSFALGLLAVALALVSPLEELAGLLFAAHMVQHLVLILVAGPLLVLGQPTRPIARVLPASWRRQLSRRWQRSLLAAIWRQATQPAIAWLLHAGALWVWHLPGPYQAALASGAVHAIEHASFLGTALVYWASLVGQRTPDRLGAGIAVLSLFAMMVQSSVLGALIVFAPAPWYPAYATTTLAWQLTPLQDQQLAGLVMWVPTGIGYSLAAFVVLGRWLRDADRLNGAAMWPEDEKPPT